WLNKTKLEKTANTQANESGMSADEILELAADLGLPIRTKALQDWSFEDQRRLLSTLMFRHSLQIQRSSRHSMAALSHSVSSHLRSHGLSGMDRYLLDNFGSFLSDEFLLWKRVLEPTAQLPVPSRRKVLWKHLLHLLISSHPSVEWLDAPSGLFRFINSESAARTWAKVKNRPSMDFEKMTHSIRLYYPGKKNIMYKGVRDLEYGFNMGSAEVRAFMELSQCAEPQVRR
uniref:ETS domain-containing protein n=1 Tax=Macrostomum lignano TaxID=282301 RepID=A0A1I8FY23_9PLAT